MVGIQAGRPSSFLPSAIIDLSEDWDGTTHNSGWLWLPETMAPAHIATLPQQPVSLILHTILTVLAMNLFRIVNTTHLSVQVMFPWLILRWYEGGNIYYVGSWIVTILISQLGGVQHCHQQTTAGELVKISRLKIINENSDWFLPFI